MFSGLRPKADLHSAHYDFERGFLLRLQSNRGQRARRMTVESPADRLTFLSPAEFGDTATYTPAGGSAVPGIAGIFNRPHVDTSVSVSSFDVTTSDTRPTFICRSADLPPPAQGGDAGDTLAIGVDTYRVLDLQPDGTGMTVVELGR